MADQAPTEVTPTANDGSGSRWVFEPVGLAMAGLLVLLALIGYSVLGDGRGGGNVAASPTDTTPTVSTIADERQDPTESPAASTTPPLLPSGTTKPPAGEPTVVAAGVREACKYGADCLIVSFKLENYDPVPTQFACEFSNESYSFDLNGREEVPRACMSGDPGDTITIVVDGVRSKTISRENLDG